MNTYNVQFIVPVCLDNHNPAMFSTIQEPWKIGNVLD